VAAVDDEATISLIRLFNEPAGKAYLINQQGVPETSVENLDLLGISCGGNLVGAIKFAKWFELGENDKVDETDALIEEFNGRTGLLKQEITPNKGQKQTPALFFRSLQ
jgi:hypothetical protein